MRGQLGSTNVADSGDVARSHGGSVAATDDACSRRHSERGWRAAPVTSRIVALVPQRGQSKKELLYIAKIVRLEQLLSGIKLGTA